MSRIRLRDEGLYPKNDPLNPEKRLALAILILSFRDLLDVNSASFKKKAEQDIQAYLKFSPGSQLKDIAEDWIFSTGTGPGSFEWVCQVLEFPRDAIRMWVKYELPFLTKEERRKITKKLPWRS